MHTLNENWLSLSFFVFVIFFVHRNCIGVSSSILICQKQGFLCCQLISQIILQIIAGHTSQDSLLPCDSLKEFYIGLCPPTTGESLSLKQCLCLCLCVCPRLLRLCVGGCFCSCVCVSVSASASASVPDAVATVPVVAPAAAVTATAPATVPLAPPGSLGPKGPPGDPPLRGFPQALGPKGSAPCRGYERASRD